MEQSKLSADTNALKNDGRAHGEASLEESPTINERSASFRAYVGPRNSDQKMVKSMFQLPSEVKDIKFFVGGVPPKMHRTALQDLFENSVIKCSLPKCKIVDVTCHEGFGQPGRTVP